MRGPFAKPEKKNSKFLITEKVVQQSSAADDLFFDKFDRTWARDPAYAESKIMTINPIETANPNVKIVDDKSIVYEYNNEWFRSDDFTTEHPEKYHILFAGCSETEGIGGSLDTVWTKMLYESLKEKYDVGGFYSIAKAGYGWQKIIINFMTYVRKYGTPTHLFILTPNLDRMFKWISDKEFWRYVQMMPFSVVPSEVSEEDRNFVLTNIPTPETHMKSLIDFTVSWKLFEAYCNSIGTKLLWSTWDGEENPNLSMFDQHNNFFEIDRDHSFEKFIKKNRPDGKVEKDDFSRRDGHSGKLFHMFWKESFENEIERLGLFND
jgi:hypothetical protein